MPFAVYCYSDREIISEHDSWDEAVDAARIHRIRTGHVVGPIEMIF